MDARDIDNAAGMLSEYSMTVLNNMYLTQADLQMFYSHLQTMLLEPAHLLGVSHIVFYCVDFVFYVLSHLNDLSSFFS